MRAIWRLAALLLVLGSISEAAPIALIRPRAMQPILFPLVKPLALRKPLFQVVPGSPFGGSTGGGTGGTGCIPGGAAGEVQYSDGAGACADEAAFKYTAASNTLTLDIADLSAGTFAAPALKFATNGLYESASISNDISINGGAFGVFAADDGAGNYQGAVLDAAGTNVKLVGLTAGTGSDNISVGLETAGTGVIGLNPVNAAGVTILNNDSTSDDDATWVNKTGGIVFTGTGADAFETTIDATVPSADTTWNIPALTAATRDIMSASSGTLTPSAACSPSETYFETDANKLWACTSTDTWTDAMAAGGGVSGLTATRVPFAQDATTLVDDADMTFATATLSVTNVSSSGNHLISGAAAADPTTASAVSLGGTSFIFEGSVADANETVLSVTNASADTTWTIPAFVAGTYDILGADTNGFVARTGSGTQADGRSIAAGVGVSVSNGDGVSGNPTVSVDTATTPQYTSGTASPGATCNVGEVYAETDALRACICSATNTWTCNGKLRNHATDCTALTDGLANEACFEVDADTIYVCEPAAGGCDTAGEWKLVSGGSGAPTTAKYIVAELDGGLSAEIAPSAADQVPVSDSTSAATWQTLPNGTVSYNTSTNAFSEAQVVPRPHSKRWAYCSMSGAQGSSDQWWCTGAWGGSSGTLVAAADSTHPFMVSTTTAATTNSDGWVGATGSYAFFWTGRNIYFETTAYVSQTTNQRAVIGFASTGTGGTFAASDDPTLSGAWFRASTNASDTNWKCITNDNSGGGTINDSGVAVGTSITKFKIVETPATNWKFYINGSLVCTNSTNLPPADTGLFQYNLIRTLADEAKVLRSQFTYFEVDQ